MLSRLAWQAFAIADCWASGLLDAPEAEATKTLSVEGEAELEAWEFKIYLDVVALRGSVPDQWVEDFKQVQVAICFSQSSECNCFIYNMLLLNCLIYNVLLLRL